MSVEVIGDAVHREAGWWTRAVHDLLRFLAEQDFKCSPRVLPSTSKPGSMEFVEVFRIMIFRQFSVEEGMWTSLGLDLASEQIAVNRDAIGIQICRGHR